METILIPYENRHLALHVPKERLKAVLESRIAGYPPAHTPADMIKAALARPIGSPRLCDLAKGKRNILIVTSDHTRPMPSGITLPILLEEIRRNNPDAAVNILVGTGLHRAPTPAEMEKRFGKAILGHYPIYVHDAFDTGQMEHVCTLPSGAVFAVNRLALQADLLITEGFIEPHFFAGFSGGRKSILPGISSARTVSENHAARAIAHKRAKSGVLAGNPIHEDMVAAARAVQVDVYKRQL